jgi:hypothetical protein
LLTRLSRERESDHRFVEVAAFPSPCSLPEEHLGPGFILNVNINLAFGGKMKIA